MPNQNPEQIARDKIDQQLIACGWVIQNKNQINFNAGIGVAVREYQTDIGPADYVLFVDKNPVGIIGNRYWIILMYFIGLAVTPDNRTFGYFN